MFNSITDKELAYYIDNALVFNMTENELVSQSIAENKFDADDQGIGAERLDFFAYDYGTGKYYDLSKKIDLSACFDTVVETSGSGFYIFARILIEMMKSNLDYSKILIVRRVASSYIFDKTKFKADSHLYNLCDDAAGELFSQHENLRGYFASIRKCISSLSDVKLCLVDEANKKTLSPYQYEKYMGYVLSMQQ